MDGLMTPQELADELGVSVAFLAQRRYHGDGPRFAKLGARKVRYRRTDVDAWIAEQTQTQTVAAS